MTLDRKRLRELAMAATPGPWFTVDYLWLPSDAETYIIAGHHDPHCGKFVCDFEDADTLDEDERNHANNAEFIAAANPRTILALLDAIEAQPPTDDARAERDALAERVDALHKALQAIAIERVGESNFEMCRVCKALCDIAHPFQHKEGCLAAPSAPKEPAGG